MALTLRKQSEDLLKRTDFKPLDELQMAEIIGFTDREKQLLKLFWDQAFNEGLIYLSDELIRTHLTSAKGKSAVANFIERKLKIADFHENQDYFELNKNSPLIQEYHAKLAIENSALESKSEDVESFANLQNSIDSPNTTSKQYFAVTSDCFKKLLMSSGRRIGVETRDVYVKIEKMAKLMLIYNNMLQMHILQLRENEKKQAQIEAANSKAEAADAKAETETIKQAQLKAEQDARDANIRAEEAEREIARIEREKLVLKLSNQYRDKREQLKPEGWIYIVANMQTFKSSMFKIGRTNDLNKRLASYHTGHQNNDRFEYLYFAEVPNAEIFEALVFLYVATMARQNWHSRCIFDCQQSQI